MYKQDFSGVHTTDIERLKNKNKEWSVRRFSNRRILFIPHVNFNACIQQPSILEVFSEYFDTIVQKRWGRRRAGWCVVQGFDEKNNIKMVHMTQHKLKKCLYSLAAFDVG